jgi:hypothetical protein
MKIEDLKLEDLKPGVELLLYNDPDKIYTVYDARHLNTFYKEISFLGEFVISIKDELGNKSIWSFGRIKGCFSLRHPKNPDLAVDTKVRVRMKGKMYWINRYFAEWGEGGRIKTFLHGADSWSSKDDSSLASWDEWELAE